MNPLWFFVILASVNGSEDNTTDTATDTCETAGRWGDGTDGFTEVKMILHCTLCTGCTLR